MKYEKENKKVSTDKKVMQFDVSQLSKFTLLRPGVLSQVPTAYDNSQTLTEFVGYLYKVMIAWQEDHNMIVDSWKEFIDWFNENAEKDIKEFITKWLEEYVETGEIKELIESVLNHFNDEQLKIIEEKFIEMNEEIKIILETQNDKISDNKENIDKVNIKINELTSTIENNKTDLTTLINKRYVDVDNYVTKKDGSVDVSSQIQQALDYAYKTNNNVIRFSKGTYGLSNSLVVRDGQTILCDDGVVFKKLQNTVMFINFEKIEYSKETESGKKKKQGYNGHSNITFIGGKYNADNRAGSIATFAHGKNIKFQGCEMYNIIDDHYLDMGAIDGLYVYECYFHSQTAQSSNISVEVIQLDVEYADTVGASLSKYMSKDGTQTVNVYIERNRCNNCEIFVGNHSSLSDKVYKNVFIKDNNCTNMNRITFNFQNTSNIHIIDNYVSSKVGVQAVRIRPTASGVTSTGETKTPNVVEGVRIEGNDFRQPSTTNNIFIHITHVDYNGKDITTNDVFISGNRLKRGDGTNNSGIYCEKLYMVNVSNNQIDGHLHMVGCKYLSTTSNLIRSGKIYIDGANSKDSYNVNCNNNFVYNGGNTEQSLYLRTISRFSLNGNVSQCSGSIGIQVSLKSKDGIISGNFSNKTIYTGSDNTNVFTTGNNVQTSTRSQKNINNSDGFTTLYNENGKPYVVPNEEVK